MTWMPWRHDTRPCNYFRLSVCVRISNAAIHLPHYEWTQRQDRTEDRTHDGNFIRRWCCGVRCNASGWRPDRLQPMNKLTCKQDIRKHDYITHDMYSLYPKYAYTLLIIVCVPTYLYIRLTIVTHGRRDIVTYYSMAGKSIDLVASW